MTKELKPCPFKDDTCSLFIQEEYPFQVACDTHTKMVSDWNNAYWCKREAELLKLIGQMGTLLTHPIHRHVDDEELECLRCLVIKKAGEMLK